MIALVRAASFPWEKSVHRGPRSTPQPQRRTGETAWRVERKQNARWACYSPPFLYEPEGAAPVLLLASYAHGITAIEPETLAKLKEFRHALEDASRGSRRQVNEAMRAKGVIVGSSSPRRRRLPRVALASNASSNR